VNKALVIGSISHEKADQVKWTQPFSDLEKYDCMIIDLASFPKDFPRTLFKNIGILKRASRLFVRDGKEIFCIMEKPFNILLKEIPLNYSWMPFPQKLKVNPMLLGKTISSTNKRFADYLENVEKWDNELFWQDTDNINFEAIATNKSQNPIAATITLGNRGKIHFLPKITKMDRSKAIKLLIDLATKKENQEYPWLSQLETPEIIKNENLRNLFSADKRRITKAVYHILKDFGIIPTTNAELDLNKIAVQTISKKGKIEAKDKEINKISEFIIKQRNKKKIIVVGNTYEELPIKNRINKQHLDPGLKLFFESNNTIFLTTLSLYNLWKKVVSGQISINEASTLIRNQSGEIKI
jgi:hypothetical protein